MGPLGSKSQERILSANSEKEKKGGEEGLGHPGELAFEWGGGEGRKEDWTGRPHTASHATSESLDGQQGA